MFESLFEFSIVSLVCCLSVADGIYVWPAPAPRSPLCDIRREYLEVERRMFLP